MQLKDQVCSLELSKRLKELGVKQDGLYIWRYEDKVFQSLFLMQDISFKKNDCVAFTVSEIAEILPFQLSKEDIIFISKGPDFYNAYYNHNLYGLGWYGVICKAKTLADCLADLLIWVLEKEIQELTNET